MVGLGVVAFRAGGVGAVGIVTAARMAAAALLAPLLATVADRVRRERVLTFVGLVRAAALGGAAAVTAAGGPIAATYGLAVVATVAQALFRPAHSALLPVLCTSPRQLTSANAVRGLLDSLATLGGPAAAASCSRRRAGGRVRGVRRRVAAGRPGGRRALLRRSSALGAAGAAVTDPAGVRDHRGRSRARADHVARLRADLHARLPDRVRRGGRHRPPGDGRPGRRRPDAAVGAGGCSGRSSRSGWSAAAGSRSGSASASRCSGHRWRHRRRPRAGGGDRAARRRRHRERPDRRRRLHAAGPPRRRAVLARMFAGFEAMLTLGVAAGAPPHAADRRAARRPLALVATGLLAPLAVAASWPALRRLDARMRVRDGDIETMRAVRMLGALPGGDGRAAGRRARARRLRAPGTRCSGRASAATTSTSCEAGRADVILDGRIVRTLGTGDASARSRCCATSRGRPPSAPRGRALRVCRLRRSAYLTAVTGYPAAAAAGEELVTSRLEADAERLRRARDEGSGGGDDAAAAGPACTAGRSRRRRASSRGGRARRDPAAEGASPRGPDVHEVRADGPDSLELLGDLLHVIGQSGVTGPVELLGEEDVLGRPRRGSSAADGRRSRRCRRACAAA